MKQNLTRKRVIIRVFFSYFFLSGNIFFEVLGKGVARGWAQELSLPIKLLFQIFRLNFR